MIHENCEVSDQKEIQQIQQDFYAELYKSNSEIKFEIENDTNIRINTEKKELLSQNFTEKEFNDALLKMQNDKTPGSDGITADFYRVMWKHVKEPFMNLINYIDSQPSASLPQTLRNGILNLIPKQGKDQRYLKNLRPITLLNSDYKLIEKVISNRLRLVLPDIIHTDQTGFMPNRRISTNIRKALDLVQYAKVTQSPMFLVNCDFLKCFDRVEFTCIQGALKYFDFPEYIINWIFILYKDFQIKIQNNGFFSNPISITRSIHQGGCCSAEIFLICAEILAILMRKNADPVTINGAEHLLNQFADDANVASMHDQENYTKIIDTFEHFRTALWFHFKL